MEGGETSWRDVVDAFVESVDLHLMADVPLGLMLSLRVWTPRRLPGRLPRLAETGLFHT